MLIDCPGCGKSYHIIKTVLGSAGRRVVCPCCDAVWFVAPDADETAAAGGDRALHVPTEIFIAPADRDARCARLAGPSHPPAELPPRRFSFVPAVPSAPARRIPRALTEICAGAALVVLMMGAIGSRAEIVRLWPRAATAYAALGLAVNLRGLALENFHTLVTNDGFQTVLGIEGKIQNLRPQVTQIPPIQLAIRDSNGHVLYSWQVAPPKRSLAANETFAFRTRLAAPPAAGRNVLVSFVPAKSSSTVSAWRQAARHL